MPVIDGSRLKVAFAAVFAGGCVTDAVHRAEVEDEVWLELEDLEAELANVLSNRENEFSQR